MKGILFKPWKIKFIADHPGMDIQTRRVIKPQPQDDAKLIYANDCYSLYEDGEFKYEPKPRYQVGDIVYIKEAWYCDPGGGLWYALGNIGDYPDPESWKSPLFMPSAYARYFTKIKRVKGERLQAITRDDSVAEGYYQHRQKETTSEIDWFYLLWNSINKDYPWETNPLVWAYTLQLVV